MVGMCWGLVSFHPQRKTKSNNPPKKEQFPNNPTPLNFPFFPIDNPLYAQSRSPSRLPKIPTTAPHQLEFKQQEYLLLAKKKTSSNLVRSERFTPESQICDSFTLECHGECMVFFVDWAGWYVIFIFFLYLSLFFFSSDSSVVAPSVVALSFDGGGGGEFGLTTTKNKKVSCWTGLKILTKKKLQLTDYFPEI